MKSGEVANLTREDFRGVRPMRRGDARASSRPWTSFAASSVAPRLNRRKSISGSGWPSDVVASIKASGRGYNARVEQALRAAGFGGKNEREASKIGAVKKRRPVKPKAKPAVGKRRA